MDRPLHDIWGDSGDGQAIYLQPDDLWDSFSASPPGPATSSQSINVEKFFPTVDPSPIPAYDSGSGDSGFLGGASPALCNAVPPPLRQTCPIPSTPHPSFQGVSSNASASNHRALTLAVPSCTLHCTYLPLGVSPSDPFTPFLSSQAPIYGTNLVPSLTSVSQDELPPQSGDDALVSRLGPVASSGLSGRMSTDLSFLGPPLDGVPQQESMLIPSPNANPPTSQRQHRVRPRKRPSTSRGPRAQLSVGSIISYGDNCRLDPATLGGNTLLDYDTVALPGQTFGQKASFILELKPYKPFTRQLYVLQDGGQPTKRRLAKVAALFVNYFIKDCKGHGQPFPFKPEDLVLLRIEVVSRSRIRPIFDVVVPVS